MSKSDIPQLRVKVLDGVRFVLEQKERISAEIANIDDKDKNAQAKLLYHFSDFLKSFEILEDSYTAYKTALEEHINEMEQETTVEKSSGIWNDLFKNLG